jgi:hypothetical protein
MARKLPTLEAARKIRENIKHRVENPYDMDGAFRDLGPVGYEQAIRDRQEHWKRELLSVTAYIEKLEDKPLEQVKENRQPEVCPSCFMAHNGECF